MIKNILYYLECYMHIYEIHYHRSITKIVLYVQWRKKSCRFRINGDKAWQKMLPVYPVYEATGLISHHPLQQHKNDKNTQININYTLNVHHLLFTMTKKPPASAENHEREKEIHKIVHGVYFINQFDTFRFLD